MLVLSRKLMEQIQIGENITVTVVHVKGKVVKLGIDAPRDIRIMRTELLSDGKEASAPDASIAHAEPTEDETSGEDEAGVTKGCHGRLARPCRRVASRRTLMLNRRTLDRVESVAID